MEQSNKGSLNKRDFKMQFKQALVWLAPLVLVYITQLQGTLQANNGLSWKDFQPTWTTIGAAQLYIINQVYGLFIKFKEGE